MAEHDSERKRARPPLPAQGVMALLERWVSELERDAPASAPAPEAPRSRNRPARERLEPDPFTDKLSAEEAPAPQAPAPSPARPRPEARPREPGEQRHPATAARAAREELRLQGLVVTLPPGDAQIVLGREGGRIVHRGTVGVRGPCAPTQEELLGLGMTKAQARALEFVLAWFGSPFDSVTSEVSDGEGPGWGVWPLSGAALIEALVRWKRREPEVFKARLERLGIDVTPGQPPEPPSLSLMDLEHGHLITGPQALERLGEDPRLLAALAQAGRERGAQLAQLEYLHEQVLRPALLSSEGSAAPLDAPGSPFATPRALALLFHTELRLGRRGVTRLVAHAHEKPGQSGSGEPAGQRFAADLQAAGRVREATELRRILSSPELAGAPS
ncbi:MAG: hypothetical protein ACJ8AT_03585 [Hyalangium sp.]|uniref:hypothetical protein n=1 Tax=Hyalangium sp. TaxID=2028555 RepID=UPI00389B02D8